jgi:hypothetical protein
MSPESVAAVHWRMATRIRAWGTRADDLTDVDDIADWYHAARAETTAKAAAGDSPHVSDRTWRDLEGDALFRSVDHTDTPLGRQRLYAMLREPESSRQRDTVDTLATLCETSPAIREALRDALRSHRGSGGYRLGQMLSAERLVTGWVRVAPVVTVMLVALLCILPIAPKVLMVVVPLAFFGIAVRLFGLSRAGVYIGPLRELAPVLRCADRVAAVLRAAPLPEPTRAELLAGLQPAGVPLSSVARWARLVSPAFIMTNELLASLFEYVNLVLLLDINALVFVSASLTANRAALTALFRAVGLVDVGCAVSSFRSTRVWCRPNIDPTRTVLAFSALQHPSLPDGITNDVSFTAGQGLMLTGANMSGKSTLLRALGVNVLLGRALNTCTARVAALPCTTVFTSIGHSDDLSRGVSYFYAEAETVATLLREASQYRALFLFDELFRGTNAAERLAAAEMVLREVVGGHPRIGPQFVAIATHDLQLGDLLADCFQPAHLAVDNDGASLRFRYTLQPGPATSRTALALLSGLGVPAAHIEAAARRAEQLERTRQR